MGRADAGVHVEHDPLHGAATMNAVDPAPGQVSQGGQVRLLHQHLGLEPTHLAGGGCTVSHRATTDDPAHGGISAKPVGIVDVLVPGEPPKTDWRSCAISVWRLFWPVRVSARTSPARSVRPRASSRSRTGSSPASDVTFEPWNSSLRRWSKTTRRAAPSASPAAPSMSSPALAVYSFVQYTEIGLAPHPATCASGEYRAIYATLKPSAPDRPMALR